MPKESGIDKIAVAAWVRQQLQDQLLKDVGVEHKDETESVAGHTIQLRGFQEISNVRAVVVIDLGIFIYD